MRKIGGHLCDYRPHTPGIIGDHVSRGLVLFDILYFVWQKKTLLSAVEYVLYATAAVQAAGILMRWGISYRLGRGHVPLSNYYESLIFFSWSLSVFMICMRKRRLYPVITFIAAGISLMLMAYASPAPGVERGIQPLIPGLAEQLAAYPRYNLLSWIRGICRFFYMRGPVFFSDRVG